MSTARRAGSQELEIADFQHIYEAWDKALSQNNPEALLALYAPDATLESPRIPDVEWLREAGEIFAKQAEQLVEKWRSVSTAHPHHQTEFKDAVAGGFALRGYCLLHNGALGCGRALALDELPGHRYGAVRIQDFLSG